MSVFERLDARCLSSGSLLCVGIDPHPQDLPRQDAGAALDFGRRLIEACAPFAAAFKPNAAFFEALGPAGMEALGVLISEIPRDIPVILDAKRGDIASTAEAYARACFEVLGADLVTLSPYLGADSLMPFLREPGRGAYVLCLTSNPGAADLQTLPLLQGGEPLWARVATWAASLGQDHNLGLVVGATRPAVLARARALHPRAHVLAPGVGAQGGEAGATVRAGLRADGLGLLVNASRALSRAEDPAAAARALRDDLNRARDGLARLGQGATRVDATRIDATRVDATRVDATRVIVGEQGTVSVAERLPDEERIALARGLVESGCVRFGSFKLRSGAISPIYIDLRRLVGEPALMVQVARALLGLLAPLTFDRIAGLPYAALPIATAMSLLGGLPMIYPRKEVKEYGTGAAIEGAWDERDRVVVVDDLATAGGSALLAAEGLRSVDLEVFDAVVLIDREGGGREALAAQEITLHAVFTLRELLGIWESAGDISPEQAREVRAFLEA